MTNEENNKPLKNLNVADLVKLLEAAKKNVSVSTVVYDQTYIDNLTDLYNRFNEETTFRPGQIVTWKKGLKNRSVPQENQPAIVIKVLDTPLHSELDSGTPYFMENLDLVLGFKTQEKEFEFMVFHYDKRRFTHYAPSSA